MDDKYEFVGISARKVTMSIIILCVLIYFLIGSILCLTLVWSYGAKQGEEVEIGLLVLFWPFVIVLDCLASLYSKSRRVIGRLGRAIQRRGTEIIKRLRSRNAPTTSGTTLLD